MQKYESLKKTIESVFSELHIKYQILDFNDEDLNYTVQISTIGKLKTLNSISGLLYFQDYDYSINFFVANIYKLVRTDNLFSLLNKINKINSTLVVGNYFITGGNEQQIIYKNTNYCGENFSGVNKELIQFIILPFIASLEDLLNSLMENTNNE